MARLDPEEAARRKKERARKSWERIRTGEAYQHYDPNDGIGQGSKEQWRAAAGGDGFTIESPQKAKAKVDADLTRLGLTEMPETLPLLVRAYRKATLTAHPDAQGGSHAAFLALTEAYNRLKLKVHV